MLEMLQLFNTWVWNIIGLIIGAPMVLMIGVSVIISLIGAVIALFTYVGRLFK